MRTVSKRPYGDGYLHRVKDESYTPISLQRDVPPRVTNFAALADAYVRAVKRAALAAFAESMHLTVQALKNFHTGWDGEAWTTPMRNGKRRVIGIQRRFPDGTKRCWPGSHGGLFIPESLNGENPVYVAEGASDTEALNGIGLPVVGLFNAGGNAEQLIQFLAGRSIVLVVDNDAKAQPGRIGGRERTATFVRRLRAEHMDLRIVHPVGAKDAREWVAAGGRP